MFAFGALQVAFGLAWVAYAVYLPDLATKAGIASGWVIWILLIDQLIFAATDALAGLSIARLLAARRCLPWLLVVAAISSARALPPRWSSPLVSSVWLRPFSDRCCDASTLGCLSRRRVLLLLRLRRSRYGGPHDCHRAVSSP